MTPDDLVVATEAHDYPLTLGHLLHTAPTCAPTREIVHGARGRYDYRELRRRIGRLAAGLAGLGVGPGATVAVMDWDSPRYLECFFVVPMMGAVLHTINVRLSPEQVLYTINHAEDDVILVHEDFIPLVAQIRDRFERAPALVLVRDDDSPAPGHPLDFAADYGSLLEGGADGYDFPVLDERTRATTFYTTGTTGDPKGVWYTHRQLVLHTLGALGAIASGGGHARLHRDDVYMPLTPMFHVHGWGMPYVATLLGIKQVYPGRYEPEALLRLIEREGVTFSHCVPTIMHMLLGHPAARETDLSGWKVVVGGSAMPAGLARAAMDRGIDVFGGYGMSETGPVLTLAQLERPALALPDEAQIDLRCKAGRPIPLVDIRVVDESMRPLPADGASAGEVVARAPWTTNGYLKDREGSEALWRGGYLHTGDIGFLDGDGYLRVTDRLKDVIKSGGEWISSIEIEDIVSRCEGVAEAAAIGVPDARWGERPLVLVVPADPERPPEEAAVRAAIREAADGGRINRWAVPDRIVLVGALDRTSVGKIDKKRLRSRYASAVRSGVLAPPALSGSKPPPKPPPTLSGSEPPPKPPPALSGSEPPPKPPPALSGSGPPPKPPPAARPDEVLAELDESRRGR